MERVAIPEKCPVLRKPTEYWTHGGPAREGRPGSPAINHLRCLNLRDSKVHKIPDEKTQGPDQNKQQWNPPDQCLAERRLSGREPFFGQNGEVSPAMRADFRPLINFIVALAAGIHKMEGKLSRRPGPL